MILFVGDVARGDRDREGFQEIDFPAFFGPIAKWAARIDDAAPHPRICRPRLARRHRRPARPGGARASPRTCCATRSRRSTARRPAGRRSARPRRGRRRCSSCSRTPPPRSRSSAAPTGARAPRIISPISPSATAFPSPPPSAARTRSTTTAAVYAGQLGYGPNPKLQQRIRDADLILAVGAAPRRSDHRRLHA